MSKAKGKLKEAAGWLTADREAEAAGRVEQAVDDPASPVEEVSDESVSEATDSLREDYGELVDPSEEIDSASE